MRNRRALQSPATSVRNRRAHQITRNDGISGALLSGRLYFDGRPARGGRFHCQMMEIAMTQDELNLAVVRATEEPVHTNDQTGFVPLAGGSVEVEREPLMIDWDEMVERRYTLMPV